MGKIGYISVLSRCMDIGVGTKLDVKYGLILLHIDEII